MDDPEDLKLKLKHLEALLDDKIWLDAPHFEIKKLKQEIDLVRLKIQMGETHDRSFR